MKSISILIFTLISFAFSQVKLDNLPGKYVYNHERYIKTIILNADSTGSWSYHNYRGSTYDFDDQIKWTFNKTTGKIILTRLTQNIDGRISQKGDKYQAVIKENRLILDGSDEIYIKQ